MSMEMESYFPPEITVDILSRLPVESLLKCKCVCKTWETLINDPFFLATYNARHESFSRTDEGFYIMGHRPDDGYRSAVIHYGEYRPSEAWGVSCFKLAKPTKSPYKWFKEDITVQWSLIGSSNGLICSSACNFRGFDEQHTCNIYVYNPMTKEYVNLGPETFAAPSNDGYYRIDFGYREAMGFGYHPSTKEYKVITINYKTRHSSGHVKVYTLGRRSSHDSSKCRWRDKGEIPYRFTSLSKPGVLVNGALHWLTKDDKIVCFDLEDEKFRNVPVPPSIVLSWVHDELGVLGGCLCVYEYNIISVWVLKQYMMGESWTKIFSRGVGYGPLKEEDIDVVLRSSVAFVSHFYYMKKKVIGLYDSSESESIVSEIECLVRDYTRLEIVAYTKSFVSLKALGEDVQYKGELPFWLLKYYERYGEHHPQNF